MELKQKKKHHKKQPNKKKGLLKLFTQRNLTEVSTVGSIFTSAKHNTF